MKEYEIFSNLKVPKDLKIILRLDGRSFHTFANNLKLKKPYDKNFSKLMVNVSIDLFKEFSPLFIYTFSDEINLILSDIPFNGRIEKLDSVFSSFASSSFTLNLNKYFKDYSIGKPISFDSRVIPITNNQIYNYFKWRQDEAWRNCINSYGSSILQKKFSKKIANEKIKGLKSQDIHELLFREGINLNNEDTWKKRGIAIYKKEKLIKGFNPKTNEFNPSFRNYIYIDYNPPIFSNKFFKIINVLKAE